MEYLHTDFIWGLNYYCLLSISIFFQFFNASLLNFNQGCYYVLSGFSSLLSEFLLLIPPPFHAEKRHVDFM